MFLYNISIAVCILIFGIFGPSNWNGALHVILFSFRKWFFHITKQTSMWISLIGATSFYIIVIILHFNQNILYIFLRLLVILKRIKNLTWHFMVNWWTENIWLHVIVDWARCCRNISSKNITARSTWRLWNSK